MLTLKRLFRWKKKSIGKQNLQQRISQPAVPFPVPSNTEEDDVMVALAVSLSLGENVSTTLPLECVKNFGERDNDCSICYGNMFEKEAHILQCCHMFCKECIRKHVQTKFAANVYVIICPLCQDTIQEEDMRELLERDMYNLWLNESFKVHLEKNRELYYHCPTPNCPAIVEKDLFDVIVCPTCHKRACIKCYNDHDEDVACDRYVQWKELNGKGDDMFKKDVKKKLYQKCPGCKRYVEKISGCNHLECRCGRKFNWIE